MATATKTQDITEILTEEHNTCKNQMNRLIKQLEKSQECDNKLLTTMMQELQLHMVLEEELVYPEMQKHLNKTQEIDMIEDSFEEHSEAKNFLIKINAETLKPEELKTLLQELLAAIEHHSEDEETELFPEMRKKLSEKRLKDIGQEYLEKQEERAGTYQPTV